jgi:carbon storage regulator
MLYISRKIGERIFINDDIVLTVVEVKGKTTKIGFEFPPTATILREELYEKIKAEKVFGSMMASSSMAAEPNGNKALPTLKLGQKSDQE